MSNFNNDDPYISIYTDQNAINDGILINISPLNIFFQDMPINRITSNLYYQLQALFTSHSIVDQLLELKRTIFTKLEFAAFKKGIWQLPPNLWLIENEVDGWTLMLPDDY